MNPIQRFPALSLLAAALFAANAQADVVISQVYGGGGNSGAPFKNDFVELFNAGDSAASLSGLSLQYGSASGNFGSSSSLVVSLPATSLQPGQYFLVKLAGGSTGSELPASDASGSANLSGSSGKIALVDGTAALACGSSTAACSAEQLARIHDLVGWGSANVFEGSAAAPGTNNATAATRKDGGCADSNHNAADFESLTPAPRNTAAAANACGAAPPPPPPPPTAKPLTIAQIQGFGVGSPVETGTEVVTEGIVTAHRANGYFIQSAIGEEDADPATAEGVFVYTGSAGVPADAAVGNRVRVTAKIGRFSRTPHGYPLTQLTGSTLELVATGKPLPPAVVLSSDDLAAGNHPAHLGRYQGMRVVLPQASVINASNDFGDFYVSLPQAPRPVREAGIGLLDAVALPDGNAITRFDTNPERLRVESSGLVGGTTLFVDNGAQIEGMSGVMYYDRGDFTLLIGDNSTLAISGGKLPQPAPTAASGALRIASYNIEFFGGGDNVPALRLEKLSQVFCDYMGTPDIVGLIEIADLASLQRLARAINDNEYGHCEDNPQYQAHLLSGSGSQRLGYLVRSDAAGDSQPRVEVLSVEEVFADARLIAPNGSDSGPLFDRAPLLLEAVVHADNGSRYPLTVLLNHTLSLLDVNSTKARSDSWGTDGARSRGKRAAQAVKVAELVEALQGNDSSRRLVLIGDYNALDVNDGYVDVMGIISGRPAAANEVLLAADSAVTQPLTNLSQTGSQGEQYTYVHVGNAQSLDHVLVNDAVLASGEVSLHRVRVNADFAVDHEADAGVPMRSSDHDPIVADVRVPSFLDSDLALDLEGYALPVNSGQRIQFPLSVNNLGQDEALQTSLELAISFAPREFKLVGNGWLCGAPVADGVGSRLACERRAPLAAGAVDNLKVELLTDRPHNALQVELRAAASTISLDRNDSNDAKAVQFLQVPAASR